MPGDKLLLLCRSWGIMGQASWHEICKKKFKTAVIKILHIKVRKLQQFLFTIKQRRCINIWTKCVTFDPIKKVSLNGDLPGFYERLFFNCIFFLFVFEKKSKMRKWVDPSPRRDKSHLFRQGAEYEFVSIYFYINHVSLSSLFLGNV